MIDKLIYSDIYNDDDAGYKAPFKYIIAKMIINYLNIDFNYEMYKVLAVVARTKIIRDLEENKNKLNLKSYIDEYDKKNNYDDKYLDEKLGKNIDNVIENINKALLETENLIITINNKPIDPKVHDTCGGATENSENVLSNEVTYLRKVLCEYCKKSPNIYSEKSFSIKDLEEKLNVSIKRDISVDVNLENIIEDVLIDDTKRVSSIKIGKKYFSGTEIMDMLNIDSTKFSIYPERFIFRTIGKGNGLGLCLYGANEMCRLGHSFKDVIDYYYTGIEVKEILRPCIKKPLIGKIIMLDPGHGGKDSDDNIGNLGNREKDIVLNICKELGKKLEELGAKVYYTRESDEFVSLNKRARLANQIRPHFFLSIHLNSFNNPSVKGCEIYHYRNDKIASGISNHIMKIMNDKLKIGNKGIKTADFYLLREVGETSIHLEVDYISSPDVEKKLMSNKYINKIAQSIGEGIVNYYRF